MPDVEVLDSTIYYEEWGAGDPIVLLHGNPTSSYLWRNVLPHLWEDGRVLAPDLIGMGRSGKPDVGYRFADHARYLDAWFDALDLDRVTLVGHDWGGALGFHWAARNPGRVAGVAFFETVIKPLTWDEWPEAARPIFQALRTPETGEDLIYERNVFVERILPGSILRTLADEEFDAYRAPFRRPADRKPTLAWPREIPIEGEPADVVAAVEAYDRWLGESREVPKLLLTFEPGAIMTPPVIEWCRAHVAGLEVVGAGPGSHFVQEDCPEAIGRHIREWRRARITGAVA